MTEAKSTDGGREETKRFENDVSAADLIDGDRIARELVAPEQSMLGDPIRRSHPEEPEQPDTKLLRATAIDSMDDSHAALLLEPESGTWLRATRLDSQQAWTQAEADWTVREVGTEIVVDEVHDLERPEDEQDDGAEEYAQTWTDILFGDLAAGHDDYADERELTSASTLRLRDFDGRKLLASINLEDGEE